MRAVKIAPGGGFPEEQAQLWSLSVDF